METMNIALPDSLKKFVQDRVHSAGYSSVSEYIRELIRADQKRLAEERIEAMLLDDSNRADPAPLSKELFRQMRRTLADRARQNKKTSD